jgi:hypothetical protein
MRVRSITILFVVLLGPALASGQGSSKIARTPRTSLLPTRQLGASALPFTDNRVHHVGNLWLTVTNFGIIGGLNGPLLDPCTRLQAPTLEFPGGSATINLWEGSVWIGAVKGRDTLVSVGSTIWPLQQHELFPDPYPDGVIEERTTRPRLKAPPGSRCEDVFFHKDAKSDYDVIARYYDTVTSSQLVSNDPDDGRPHMPLGVEITQSSYSWSLAFAQDFILIDYKFRNLSDGVLKDAYLGVYIDQDVHHPAHGDGWLDDICGFLRTVPSQFGEEIRDTVNIAWSSDNDGDPANGKFDYASNPYVSGVRILKLPEERSRVTFNWFVGDGGSAVDWGPVLKTSKVVFLRSGLGAPYGDVAKYQMLSNGEIDYDQIEAAIDHQAEGWLPPAEGTVAPRIADGWDTRWLLGAGPFDLPVDSTVSLVVAVVAGEGFHASPTDFATFWDPANPQAFRDRLDVSDLALNARWADWVYDTPGYDTDGDGYAGAYRMVNGKKVYYRGDGVPDFTGPPAPPAPEDLRFETSPGKITVRWNGETSEKTRDPFSNVADFEGYRVYMSRTGIASDFVLLAQRDLIDYTRHVWSATRAHWVLPDPPFTLDSLKTLYDSLVLADYGTPFHPDSFAVPELHEALRVIYLDPKDESRLDTFYYYFTPFDANIEIDDAGLAEAERNGLEVLSTIRRVHPGASPDSVATRDDGTPFAPYYEYEFAITGLQPVEPVYIAVTVSDFGYPGIGLDPLETSPLGNAEQVWPTQSAQAVKSERPAPGVYPNPYRLADLYNLNGWEDPRRQGLDPERARKVTFTNVPDTCVVSIFSLDGDLVRRIDHHASPSSSDASIVVWDLITRNTQAVKSGLYLWTVESRFGVDVGKLVVIK